MVWGNWSEIVLKQEVSHHTDAERTLIAADRRKGGAYEIELARNPEFCSRPDQAVPDLWYREAERVAATLGQPAATAMLQREGARRLALRLAAARERQARASGTARWLRRLGAAGWQALGCSVLAALGHVLMATSGAPAARLAQGDTVLVVLVALCTLPWLCMDT